MLLAAYANKMMLAGENKGTGKKRRKRKRKVRGNKEAKDGSSKRKTDKDI